MNSSYSAGCAPKERFRYHVDELNGYFFVTSPDCRSLLLAKRSREAAIAAIPEALQRFRFHRDRTWSPVPSLDLVEA